MAWGLIMDKADGRVNGFVADGYERARAANEPFVRAEVEKEFADELRNASAVQLWSIRWRMQREIERRLERLAPPDALY